MSNSNEEDINEAVAVARTAHNSWARMSGFERGQILRRAAEICRVRVYYFNNGTLFTIKFILFLPKICFTYQTVMVKHFYIKLSIIYHTKV